MFEHAIVLFMLFNALVEIYLTLRNIISLFKERSKVAKSLSTEEEYKQMQDYNKDKFFFSIFKCIILTIKEVIIVKYRINQLLYDNYFRNSYMNQVFFFLANYNLNTIFDIPFRLYSTFRIEHIHGFNKMSLLLFFTDLVKSTLIFNIIFFFILHVALNLISSYINSFWLYLWVFMSITQLVMVVIYPVYIQPLFNKFTELEEGTLKEKITSLCKKIGFKASKVLVMDGSKRSSHSNAYFIGLFKEKRIVLYDTLKNQMDEDEILAVLCHEFGHWYKSHTLKLVFCALIQQLFYFWSTNQLLNNEYFSKALFYQNEPLIIKLMYVVYFLNIAEIPISLSNNVLSRSFEREADVYAVKQGYGKELSSALVKLSKENKGNLSPDSLYSTFYNSHPTVVERMQLIEDEMKKIK